MGILHLVSLDNSPIVRVFFINPASVDRIWPLLIDLHARWLGCGSNIVDRIHFSLARKNRKRFAVDSNTKEPSLEDFCRKSLEISEFLRVDVAIISLVAPSTSFGWVCGGHLVMISREQVKTIAQLLRRGGPSTLGAKGFLCDLRGPSGRVFLLRH